MKIRRKSSGKLYIRDADTVYYGTEFLRILCISVAIYPLLFVIIAVFQAMGQGVQSFVLSLLNKGTLDIALFFVIRMLFGLEQVLWATPIVSAIALAIGAMSILDFFRKHELK